MVSELAMLIRDRLQALVSRLNRATGGVLGVVHDAFASFGAARASQAAAGMAYYTLLSLFPLALFLVSLGSLFLKQQSAYAQVMDYLSNAIPVSRALINQNLEQVIEARGPVGLAGLIGSIWSASGAFAILAKNLNLAWQRSAKRGFVRERLLALGMIMVLAALLLLSVLSTTIIGLLARANIPLVSQIVAGEGLLWRIASRALSSAIAFVLFLALYRWVPSGRPPWRWTAVGALFAAIAWEAAINLFAWYASSGLASYAVIYGSLGSVVVLLIWIYLSAWITLFGAHLSAAIAEYHAQQR